MTPERIDTGCIEINFSCKGIRMMFKNFTVKLRLSRRNILQNKTLLYYADTLP
jgi:hypothetical protein